MKCSSSFHIENCFEEKCVAKTLCLCRAPKTCRRVVWDKQIFPLGKQLLILICLIGKGSGSRLSTVSSKEQMKTSPGKQNLRATCPKGKLEFNFFFQPCCDSKNNSICKTSQQSRDHMETTLHCEQKVQIRKYAKLNNNKEKLYCAADRA